MLDVGLIDLESLTDPKMQELQHNGPPPNRKFIAVIEVTYQCNLACAHCHIGASPAVKDVNIMMPQEHLRKLLSECAALGVEIVYFSGGEPTLYPNIVSFVEQATTLGMRAGIITNGYALDRSLLLALRSAGLGFVGVSLNAHDADSYARFTGRKDAFDRAVRALGCAKELGFPRVMMLTVAAHPSVRDRVDDLIELASRLHVDFGDERPVPLGRARELRPSTGGVSRSEKEAYRNYLLHLHAARQRYPHIEIISNDPLWDLVDPRGPFTYTPPGEPFDMRTPRCPSGWHICVTPDLKMKPCAFARVLAADLTKTSLGEAWERSRILRLVRNKDNLGGKCGRCAYRYACGGCRASAFAYTGDFFGEDPLCWLDSVCEAAHDDPITVEGVEGRQRHGCVGDPSECGKEGQHEG